MNLIEQLNNHKEDYTKTDLNIYQHIIEDLDMVVNHNITNLAAKLDTSTAALSRFIKKNGFDNYSHFRLECMKFKNSEWNQTVNTSRISNFTNLYATLVNELPNYVSQKQLDYVTNVLMNSKRTISIGYYRSELYARKLSIELLPYEKYVEVPNLDTSMRYFDSIIEGSDCLILFSESMKSSFIKGFEDILNNYNGKIIVISTNSHPIKEKLGNTYIQLPNINNFPKSRNLDNAIIINLFINLFVNNYASHTLGGK